MDDEKVTNDISVEARHKTNGINYYYCRYDGKLKCVKEETLVEAMSKQDFFDALSEVTSNGEVKILKKSGEDIPSYDIGLFVVADELALTCQEALTYKRRYVFEKIEAFCNAERTTNKVGLIMGMRNTGKTILMKQLAGREAHIHCSAYATLDYHKQDIAEVFDWVNNLCILGYKYIYIDEVTWADGFVAYANRLADKWASYPGVKIIVSGTDSLAMYLARVERLYHRTVTVNTTPMSFVEYKRLMGGDVLGYVRNGGVFWETVPIVKDEFDEYLSESIVKNIYRTLHSLDDMRLVVKDMLYNLSEDDLSAVLYAICENVAKDIVYVRSREVWGKNLGFKLRQARIDSIITIGRADWNNITRKRTRHKIDVVESRQYNAAQVSEVVEVLINLSFLRVCPVYIGDSKFIASLMFTQTGVAREFVNQVVKGLMASSGLTDDEKSKLIHSLEMNVDGMLLETAVISTLQKKEVEFRGVEGKDFSVYKYRKGKIADVDSGEEQSNGSHEIDVVVHFPFKKLILIEVKRNINPKSNQARHLISGDALSGLLKQFPAKKVERIVLYRGSTQTRRVNGVDVLYKNIEDYLSEVESWQK